MKTFYSLLCTAILIIAPVNLHATIWTVDNNPGNSAADFTSLATAEGDAGVLAGDTIYVAGSSLAYGASVTLTKKLYIFGPGYFLAENIDLQANTASATITGSFTFSSGSEGSIVQGLSFTSYVYLYTSNITFRRNRTYNYVYTTTSKSNVIFTQNYCTMNTSSPMMDVGASNTNILISNNFFENTGAGSNLDVPAGSNAIITNNVFSTTGTTAVNLNTATGNFDNNIIYSGTYSGTAILPRNNITSDTTFSNELNGNKSGRAMNTVFVLSGSPDARWQILAAGPADNAGLSGEDCGMYGGNSPYVISGLPPIPTIYFLSAPVSGSAAQGLPVTIKAKSHN